MEENNMRFKVGDLIQSVRHDPAGRFKLAIITGTSKSEHRNNFFYYHLFVVDWDEHQRYSAYVADNSFDLISAP